MKYNRLHECDSLEKEIKDIVINNKDFSEVLSDKNYFEYHYFLSFLRHDLFKWFPFKKDESILEIGSGYGQLTEFFTQKVNHVVAVEDSESKAEIVSKRAGDAEVVVADFGNLNLDEKFDYIILCNTFEYSKSFFDTEDPFVDYLKYLKGFLKEDGRILIALSNRLGLKYFAGFKEEHSNQFFKSINGYDDVDDFETFSKTELIDIIENADFSNYKFYYPYPDHEFPMIIHTDALVNKVPYERRIRFYDERLDLYREDNLNQTLAKDNLADYFANSFLVEIRNGFDEYDSDKIMFVKLNSDRKEKFRTCTIIHSDGMVSKAPISQLANIHVEKMYDARHMKIGRIRHLDAKFEDDTFYYPFLNQSSFEDLIMQTIHDDDKEAFFELLDDYYDALFYNSFKTDEYASKEFLSIFKKGSDETFHCHEKSNLDLIFSNIFIIDGEYVAIDYEWLFDFPIPLEFIFYRVIIHHRLSNVVFHDFVQTAEILNHYNIDISHVKLFKKWDKNLMRHVFGNYDKVPVPIHQVILRDNLYLPERFNEYVNLHFDPENMDDEREEFLKRELVIKQRRIIDSLNRKYEKSQRAILRRNNKILKQNDKIKQQKAKIKKQDKEINSLMNSSSWRLTKPLRKIKSIFK